MNVAFAFQIKSSTEFIVANETDKLTVEFDYDYMYNRTEPDLDVDVSDIIKRALFKAFHPEDPKADINVYWESKQLKGFDSSALFDSAICLLGPLFIPLASLSLLSITLGILIDDIQTPMRPYMIASGLSRKAYWIGNYIFDFGISTIYSLILIAIYESVENVLFRKLAYISIPFILISNIVTIPYTYFWAFIFKSKTIGTGVYSVVNTVLLIAMMVVKSVLSNKKTADMIGGAFSILPFIASLNVISSVANQLIELRFNVPKKYNFFSTGPQRTAIVMFFIDLFLWPIIVSFEEYLIFFATKTMSKMGWTGHEGEFRREKDKHMRTKEATDMEQTILNSSSSENYVIKIRDVSKHFVDSNGKSIYAVNQVSLGIKQGSLFGFLGSNGAGKTTLMKMILKEEPLSNGSIEVEGLDIDLAFDPTRIAICPQFDDHLTKELTGYQNLKFFCYIYNKTGVIAETAINNLVDSLELNEHINKQVKAMSGGNARKCSVATTFLSDAHIILLDEPTSSLDPIARHKVHELINRYKGVKTFMLCTHLLDEAENLCDTISIMLNGCVYTIGSPQYLANKFGTEWKVDILLDNPSQGTQNNINDFITREIPMAYPTIIRPTSRIYSIPRKEISITELFKKLDAAQQNNIGIKYYTCSCSTLEKVFLEIIMLSELRNLESDTEMSELSAQPRNLNVS